MLRSYIRDHLYAAVLLLSFSLIFIVVLYLFRLPLAAVGYAAAICAFIGLVLLVIDYCLLRRRHRRLQLLREEVTISLSRLPESSRLIEQDYQQLLRILFEDKARLVNELDARYFDQMEYYAIWAHQIKTPIAALRLSLQSEEEPDRRELQDEVQRIEQYVEMALGYLRLDSDSSDLLIREYELDDVIRQAVRKYASRFIRQKIALDYQPTGYRVLSDEKWLLFIIEQLLSNALKYTRSGSISINMPLPGVLEIRDTGIGIAPEDLPRIFEKGYTGYNGRADKKSTGIGLYLCRRIAHKLGHGISASSQLGQGTCIRLELTRAELQVE